MIVELVYRAYAKKQDEITRGFITQEQIEWVTDHLMLRELTDQELSEMWEAVDDFFDDMMAERDENGNITGWKPYTCREMSQNVAKCREMSQNVAKCRKMS